MKKYLCLILLFWGCRSSEKIAQKALTDQAAFYKVGNIFRRLNPCVNDTTIISKQDTIETLHIDTITNVIQSDNIIDTVYVRITKYKQLNIHDTIKLFTRDLTTERILTDSFITYKNLYLQENALTLEARQEMKKFKFNFWMLLIVIVSFSILSVYLKFKTKFP
jgi:hypothetical protein